MLAVQSVSSHNPRALRRRYWAVGNLILLLLLNFFASIGSCFSVVRVYYNFLRFYN